MSKNLVVYENSLNQLKFGVFSGAELDIFFTLLLKFREKGTETQVLTFNELKNLSETDISTNKFVEHLKVLNRKLLNLHQEIVLEDGTIHMFPLFTDFGIHPTKKTLETSIHPKFGYLLNNILGNFTKFDLEHLVRLKSSYSKNLFRQLKQFENANQKKHFFEISLSEFREKFQVPQSYEMCNLDSKVFNPAIKELQDHFKGLKLEKLNDFSTSVKRGQQTQKLKFTWKTGGMEKINKNQMTTDEKLELVKTFGNHKVFNLLQFLGGLEKMYQDVFDFQKKSKLTNQEIKNRLTEIYNDVNLKPRKTNLKRLLEI